MMKQKQIFLSSPFVLIFLMLSSLSFAKEFTGLYLKNDFTLQITQKSFNRVQVRFSNDEIVESGEVKIYQNQGIFLWKSSSQLQCEIKMIFSPQKVNIDDQECGYGFFQMAAGTYIKKEGRKKSKNK